MHEMSEATTHTMVGRTIAFCAMGITLYVGFICRDQGLSQHPHQPWQRYPAWVAQQWKSYIAQLELLAVLVARGKKAEVIRRGHGPWCIDNVAALMSLVRGSSGAPSLDKMAEVVHLGAFAREAEAYYEYVESKANWSDEISRGGTKGSLALRCGFEVS